MGLIDKYDGFDWDEGNRGKNFLGHGVTDEEIEEAYSNDPYFQYKDTKHSEGEERWVAMAQTDRGGPLFMVHTIRNNKIRPISAWPMGSEDRGEFYEKVAEARATRAS